MWKQWIFMKKKGSSLTSYLYLSNVNYEYCATKISTSFIKMIK